MNRFFFLICSVISFILITSFISPKLSLEENITWTSSICISDSGLIQIPGPFSAISSENVILTYTAMSQPSMFEKRNLYIKNLKNGMLGEAIALTNSSYNSVRPLIKTDRKGITHMVWGSNTTQTGAISFVRVTDIYYSFYNGSAWSVPKSIFHKDTSGNSNAYANARLALDSQDRLHLLWVVNDPITGSHFCHKVEENNSWSETEDILFRSADYDFIFDKNDRLHLAYFRPVIGRFYDENSVFYRYSDDYGKTWSDSILVRKSGNQIAIRTQILLDHLNNIHILWTKNLSGNKWGGEAILHSFSSDGIIWTKPIDAVPRSADGFLYFSAAIDNYDKIHLTYDFWGGFGLPPVKLLYAWWDGANWRAPDVISHDAEWPYLEIDYSGYLHLTYLDTKTTGFIYYIRSIGPVITGIDKKKVIPENFELYQNFPNPFNPETSIEYRVGSMEYVSLKVYDLRGKEISTLVNEYQSPGVYNYRFSADELKLSSGVYFYQLKAGAFIETKKFVLLK